MKEKTHSVLPDIQRTIIMDAPIQKVWNAISTSEGLAAWLISNDFKLEMGYEFTFHSEPQHGWGYLTEDLRKKIGKKMMDTYPKHDVFHAIADPTRRELLSLLADKELPVTVISGHFPITRTAVSKHLHILADAGLVSERKVGRETRYKLQPEPLLELKQWLSHYERFWDKKLNALKNFVETKET